MRHLTGFTLNRLQHAVRLGVIALCAGLLGGHSLQAAGDATSSKSPIEPAADDPTYNNWVDLSLGGLMVRGDKAQFSQEHGLSSSVFGGIEDMHLEEAFANKAQLTLDGHAIFANNDYKVKLELSLPDVGYIRAGYTEFRTWSSPYGGYLSPDKAFPDGVFVPPATNAFALDRGDAWIELGLQVPSLPQITLRYDHMFRNGQEDSTEWASTTQTGIPNVSPNSSTRKIVPSFYDINEKRDIFTLDIKKTLSNTDFELGMRYEHDTIDDSLHQNNLPGTPPTALANNRNNIPLAAGNYYVTEENQESLDLFNGNFSSVTRFNDKLWVTLGYSYTSMNSSIGGSQINGGENGAPFGTGYFVIGNQVVYSNSSEFVNLGGGSMNSQNVATLSARWEPVESLTITPSVRIESNDTDSNSLYNTTFNQTNGSITVGKGKAAVKVPIVIISPGITATPTSIATLDDFINVAESLELRYTGLENWVFYAQGDWEEENETRQDFSPTSTNTNLDSNISRLRQKYTAGANWYPLSRLNVSFQYYHQMEDFDQNLLNSDTGDGNQRLLNQNWNTDDVNLRVTWRPLSNISLVSRYDFQYTKIDSQWGATAPPDPFLTTLVAANGESGAMTNNMLTECVTWSPLDRLFIQGNASYVLNNTSSPASVQIPAVMTFRNDYWTAGIGAGYKIDDKTDLDANYSYYRADNYVNDSSIGVPYGAGCSEHDVSASISRQISKNVRVMLKYSFDMYRDQLSGGLDNFTAQTIYTSLQIRF